MSLDNSFLEDPIPQSTQKAIANCLWNNSRFQLQPYFRYYTDQCRFAVQSYSGYLPVKTHQHLVNIALDILNGHPHHEVKARLVARRTQIGETDSEDSLNASIDLTLRLIYMVDVGVFRNAYSGRERLVWDTGTSKTFIENKVFRPEMRREHNGIKLEPVFDLSNIVRIGGFRVELTSNLSDHLLLRDTGVDKSITIFHHASFLMGQKQYGVLTYTYRPTRCLFLC